MVTAPVIPALKRQRQEEHLKFQASLSPYQVPDWPDQSNKLKMPKQKGERDTLYPSRFKYYAINIFSFAKKNYIKNTQPTNYIPKLICLLLNGNEIKVQSETKLIHLL